MTDALQDWSATDTWARDDDGRPTRLDGSEWHDIEVPSHWRTTPAFARSDGPILYRTGFRRSRPGNDERRWLHLDGAFYTTRTWIDGEMLGERAPGYFVPTAFEVTEALRQREEHELLVEVQCPRPHSLAAKTQVTGVFEHWDFNDPAWNPGGLWRPVHMRSTGPVRIVRARVLCTSASEDRAALHVEVDLDADRPRRVALEITIANLASQSVEQFVPSGSSRIAVTIPVRDHALWWPHSLGDAQMYDVEVRACLGSSTTDSWRCRTGFRAVAVDGWQFRVNGVRLFVKGTTLVPSRVALGEASAADLQRDVALAVGAGFDLAKVVGHVSRPELYEAADEAGLLLWQDLPLHRGYARSVRTAAKRQAPAAVDLLGHHPSIALWCAHNTPFASAVSPGGELGKVRLAMRLASHYTPSYNRTLLDYSIKRAFERADASRPAIAHSGLLPGPNGGSDPHLYFGWYQGRASDLEHFADIHPRAVRFVGEFGGQGLPTTATFMQPERFPDLDWSELTSRFSYHDGPFDRFAPPSAHADFDSWRDESQRYQGELCRSQIEFLRLRKYRPVGGFAQFCLNDGSPGVTWSLVDADGVPKASYEAVRRACRDLLAVARGLRSVHRPDERVPVHVHVVNDRQKPIHGATVAIHIDGGPPVASWRCDIPADDSCYVGTHLFHVPGPSSEPHEVAVVLTADGETVRNEYWVRVDANATVPSPSVIERVGRVARVVRTLGARTPPAGG